LIHAERESSTYNSASNVLPERACINEQGEYMRKLGISVMVCLLAVATGCGSSNSNDGAGGSSGGKGGVTAAGGSNDGTTAVGGSSGGASAVATGGSSSGASAMGGSGGGTGASSCVLPSCLKNLGTGCVESGSCATQTNLETGSWNTCYDNGIAEIVVNDVNTDDMTMTVKNGSSTCFSTAFNRNDVYTCVGSITVKDASGAAVASVTLDCSGAFYTVTCTGGQAVALDPSCGTAWPISMLMGSGCNEGGCTP